MTTPPGLRAPPAGMDHNGGVSFYQSSPDPSPQGQAEYSASLTGQRGETPEEVLRHRKKDFRTLWRARRRELGPVERTAQSEQLAAQVLDWYLPRATHRRVAVVMSYGTEPETGPLREALHAAGVEVLVPITEPERQLSWTAWHPGIEVARSPVAPIDEPVGERLGLATFATVDLVLVPAQVVDQRGIRLGQGGGYYDRFLAALQREVKRTGTGGDADGSPTPPLTVATVYRHELLTRGQVPSEEFDEAVDGAVTADGFTWFGGTPD
jgi:5-formyltetrahydrofolate cyclo-ligase